MIPVWLRFIDCHLPEYCQSQYWSYYCTILSCNFIQISIIFVKYILGLSIKTCIILLHFNILSFLVIFLGFPVCIDGHFQLIQISIIFVKYILGLSNKTCIILLHFNILSFLVICLGFPVCIDGHFQLIQWTVNTHNTTQSQPKLINRDNKYIRIYIFKRHI